MALSDAPGAPQPQGVSSPLGIICGGGSLPLAVADAVAARGRPVFLFPLRGWADAAAVARHRHAWVDLGRFGRFRRLAQAAGCRDIVCIGTLVRPAIAAIALDWTTLRLLPRLALLFRGGDDHLLSGLGRIFEENGFRLLGAHEAAPELLAPAGPLGSRRPGNRDLADISRGMALIDAMGPFDVGQAVVVAAGRVLAVEAAEGTDAMLARVAELRRSGRIRTPLGTGVLVKAPKPGQHRAFDLPSIGPGTVDGVRAAGLAGLAVRAGEVLLAEPNQVARTADAAGLFVVGMPPGAPAS